MTTAKIAVSLPEEVLRRARRAIRRGRAPSMSAYVAAALEQKSKLDDLEDLLAEMLSETGGPLTAKERRIADRTLFGKRVGSSRAR
jgi:Arc/MetJ-type ribon-helix-helix transcriptional regulator